ncbi:MAG: hypothetical protein IJ147_04795 [Lachnospiraceae bacterium]|nr:hypothetical protein [Lachnospiraceae bacterium]
MDEMMEKMDLNTAEETGANAQPEEADVEIAAEISAEQKTEAALNLKDEKAVRQALEQARAAETRAYAGMTSAAALTQRQKGVLELAKLEELDHPTTEQQDKKCRLILESYYLPHIAKDGFTVKLDPKFTRTDEPDRDYIEATFTNPTGKSLTVGYNYKTAEDGKNILVFEKSFQNIVLKPGEPEKYVLYAPNGKEIESLTMEELEEKIETGEVVKLEQGYFQKAKDEDGIVRKGVTTPIVEIETGNGKKMSFGNNERHKFTLGKNGQLTCATTNDVITTDIETRSFSSGPVYDSAEAAKVAAQGVIQAGEANPRIEISMEGTTVADFTYLPTLKTSVELAGLSRKLGKGMEGYDPNDSEGENLRRQFDKPIRDYLSEKGYYVLDIVCENLMADVTENVGFMNTMKTYQMTGGVVSVTYIKKHTQFVSIKQGVLGRKQGNNIDAILAQLPAGSEILNPEDINWKNSKEEVAYVTHGKATGIGSAPNTSDADDKAAENAIIEAQKIVARSINGSIASGIKEAIDGHGASSTVASVRARLTTAVVSKNDMELTHKEAKYAYSGTCDKMVSTSENKLVSVTSWSGNMLTYVEAKEPVIDKGIPTDGNYEKFINEGDDSGILLFEKTDVGLRRYMKDVMDAQSKTKIYREMYIKARANMKEMQSAFDVLVDERLGLTVAEDAEEPQTESVEKIADVTAEKATDDRGMDPGTAGAVEAVADEALEVHANEAADEFEEMLADESAEEAAVEPVAPAVDHAAAQEALLSIFGDMPVESAPEADSAVPEAEAAEPVFDLFAKPAAPAVDFTEPAAPAVDFTEPVAPAMEPVAPAVDHAAAQEALLSIFGDMPVESAPEADSAVPEVEAAEPVVTEAVAVEPIAAEPAEAVVAEVVAETGEPEEEAGPVFDLFAKPAAPAVEPAAPAVDFREPAAPAVEPAAPAVEPAAPAVDHAAAQEALLSIFGDMPESAPATAPVEEEITHRQLEELVFEGESDMPVARRPVTENRYERPEAPRTEGSDLYVRPMPVIAEGETIARADRSEVNRPSISLDGTYVVPLPDMPDIQIQRTEGAPVGSNADTSAVDAAWERLMNGVTDNP